tara:strand:+ start:825 stop:1181 length:357 start_codon:yes stop_codon:yes gene_type:complete
MALFENSPAVERHPITHWVQFRGSGTVAILADGNVSSVSDDGTGNYTVNFSTNMPDTNYCFFGNTLKGDTNNDGNQHLQMGGNNTNPDVAVGSIGLRAKVATNNADNDPDRVTCGFTR